MDTEAPFGLVVAERNDTTQGVKYVAELSYSSTGDRVTAVQDAVIISVDGVEAGRISVPLSAGKWFETVDLTKMIKPGQRNDLQIYTTTYNLDILGGRLTTQASVSVRFGRRLLFDATYSVFDGRRIAKDEWAFIDDRAAP